MSDIIRTIVAAMAFNIGHGKEFFMNCCWLYGCE